jgi:monoamine oxidase
LLSQFDEASVEYQLLSFILSSEFEQEFSGSAGNISAHWYDSIKEFEGNDAIFVQGFKVITEFLANGLNIELGQIAKEIQWHESQVRVITGSSEFVADHVIVTIPLGVLQEKLVRFQPDLPSKKLEAIDKLGMGLLNKCYLRFDKAFWPDDVDWLEYISPKHGEWTEWVSFQQVAKQPILLGFNSADRARELESWSDQEIVADAMETLRNIFGEDVPAPIDYQITRWGKDPFSLGSYSFNALGSTPDMRRVLAEPLGIKVFFAGEATERDYFGTAHGAYLSGLCAAKKIV